MTLCLPLSIFRFPSTFLIPLKSQLDDAVRGPLYNCLDIKLEGCKRYKPEESNFMSVLLRVFSIACLKIVNILEVKKKLKRIRLVKSA